MRQEKGVQCALFEGKRRFPVPMDETPTPRSNWWGRSDWFVFVPGFLVLASFWIYLFGPDRAPWTVAMHEFYGMRHTAEIHTPWVMFGSLLIILYSFTLFLRRRLLFGRVARSWTIAIAILFIGLAAATGLEAWATYASSFL
jgi:hypothetical protein